MSRARDFADLAGSADAGGLTGRNLIINGAMQVAQRGTQTGVTNDFACDRFNVVDNNTTAVVDASQSSTSPDGFANSLKVDVTTAQSSLSSNSIHYIRYKFEGQDIQQLQYGTSSAKKVTVSFYVRSSTTGTYVFSMFANDSSRTTRQTYTIDSADTWEQKTLTFNGDTSNGFDDDNNVSLSLHWVLAVGSDYTGGSLAENTWGTYADNLFAEGQTVNLMSSTSNDFHLTGVQLELGEQATPFEHRSFGDELRRCMRYYEKGYDYDTALGTTAAYPGNIPLTVRGLDEETSGQRYFTHNLKVEKRSDPTNTYYDESGNTGKVTTYDSGGTPTNNVSIALVVTMRSRIGCGPGNSAIWGHGFFYESDAEL